MKIACRVRIELKHASCRKQSAGYGFHSILICFPHIQKHQPVRLDLRVKLLYGKTLNLLVGIGH